MRSVLLYVLYFSPSDRQLLAYCMACLKMPCGDCVAVTAELAAQKRFMVEWFGIFMKELEQAKVERADIGGKIIQLSLQHSPKNFPSAQEDLTNNDENLQIHENSPRNLPVLRLNPGFDPGSHFERNQYLSGTSVIVAESQLKERPQRAATPDNFPSSTAPNVEEFFSSNGGGGLDVVLEGIDDSFVKEEHSPEKEKSAILRSSFVQKEECKFDCVSNISESCVANCASSTNGNHYSKEPGVRGSLRPSDVSYFAVENDNDNRSPSPGKGKRKRRKAPFEGGSVCPHYTERPDYPRHIQPGKCRECGGVTRPQIYNRKRYRMRCGRQSCRKYGETIVSDGQQKKDD